MRVRGSFGGMRNGVLSCGFELANEQEVVQLLNSMQVEL
jgi:hypothetical protein